MKCHSQNTDFCSWNFAVKWGWTHVGRAISTSKMKFEFRNWNFVQLEHNWLFLFCSLFLLPNCMPSYHEKNRNTLFVLPPLQVYFCLHQSLPLVLLFRSICGLITPILAFHVLIKICISKPLMEHSPMGIHVELKVQVWFVITWLAHGDTLIFQR